jgi:hemerythrin superfamily protein
MSIFDTLLSNGGQEKHPDPIEMLKQDHEQVKQLFERFESSAEDAEKKRLADRALVELTIHAVLEEELFYPAVRRATREDALMDEAAEEHHVAKILIGELSRPGRAGSRFEAKFKVLAESVRHHIEEEEEQMLPKASRSGLDLQTLGRQMSRRKIELRKQIESPSDIPVVPPPPRAARRAKRSTRARIVSRRSHGKDRKTAKR